MRVVNIEQLGRAAKAAKDEDGPHFIVADVNRGDEQEFPSYTRGIDVEHKFRFMRHLEEVSGKQIHEDAIDVKLSLR